MLLELDDDDEDEENSTLDRLLAELWEDALDELLDEDDDSELLEELEDDTLDADVDDDDGDCSSSASGPDALVGPLTAVAFNPATSSIASPTSSSRS